MTDLKSVFYTSVGLVLKGKKKVEKAARQFVEDNRIEAAEGKKLIDKTVKYVKDAKEELSEKISEAARQFVEDNRIEAAEGKKLIDKTVKYVKDVKEELSKKISETVKTTINKMDLITHKEVAELKNEIKNLKTQLHKSTDTKNIKQKIKKSQKK